MLRNKVVSKGDEWVRFRWFKTRLFLFRPVFARSLQWRLIFDEGWLLGGILGWRLPYGGNLNLLISGWQWFKGSLYFHITHSWYFSLSFVRHFLSIGGCHLLFDEVQYFFMSGLLFCLLRKSKPLKFQLAQLSISILKMCDLLLAKHTFLRSKQFIEPQLTDNLLPSQLSNLFMCQLLKRFEDGITSMNFLH